MGISLPSYFGLEFLWETEFNWINKPRKSLQMSEDDLCTEAFKTDASVQTHTHSFRIHRHTGGSLDMHVVVCWRVNPSPLFLSLSLWRNQQHKNKKNEPGHQQF